MSELSLEVPQTPFSMTPSVLGGEANLRGLCLMVGCFASQVEQSSRYLGRRAHWGLRSGPSQPYKVSLHGHKQNNPSAAGKGSAAQYTACVLLLIGFSYKSVFLCLCLSQALPQVQSGTKKSRIVLRCLVGVSCTSTLASEMNILVKGPAHILVFPLLPCAINSIDCVSKFRRSVIFFVCPLISGQGASCQWETRGQC